MKVVAKPKEMVAWFDNDGVHPTRFKVKGKDRDVVDKISRVIKKDIEKLAGN